MNSATPSQGDRATDAAASKTLLGSWKYVERELGKIRVRIRFEPDGRAQIDNFRVDGSLEDSSSGTYRILGNKLSIVLHDAAAPNAAVIMTKSYYAGAKKLLMGAWLPTASHRGIVGKWEASEQIEYQATNRKRTTEEYFACVFQSDGTEEFFKGWPPKKGPIRYTADSPTRFTVLNPENDRPMLVFELIDDAALAGAWLEDKVDPLDQIFERE